MNYFSKVLKCFFFLFWLFSGSNAVCLEREHRSERAELCFRIMSDLHLNGLTRKYHERTFEYDRIVLIRDGIDHYNRRVGLSFFSGNEESADDFQMRVGKNCIISILGMETDLDSFVFRLDGSKSDRILDASYSDFVRFLTAPGCPLNGIVGRFGRIDQRDALTDYIIAHEAEMATYASEDGTHAREREILLGIGNEDLLIDENLLMHFMRALFNSACFGVVDGDKRLRGSDGLLRYGSEFSCARGLTFKSARALSILCRGLNS